MTILNATIRPAVLNDVDQMIVLLKSLFEIEEDFIFDYERQKTGITMLLNSGRGLVLVAEYNNTVIGMCTGQTVISTAEGGYSLLVEDVVVTSTYRGQGLGRQLLSTLENWAQQQNIHRLQLLADRNNTNALSFYTTTGWKHTELVCLRTYTNEKCR